jgi:uncharacterized membrane protein
MKPNNIHINSQPAPKLARVILLVLLFTSLHTSTVWADNATPPPVVSAVLYWMEGCPGCEEVLQNALPPLQEKYGEQLQITLVEVISEDDVDELYELAASFGMTREDTGVPLLVIGGQALVGEEISNQLPAWIETYLQAGGNSAPFDPASIELAETSSSMSETEQSGFGLAYAVLVFILLSLMYVLARFVLTAFQDRAPQPVPDWQNWIVLALGVVGLGVAGYLAYVETQMVSAVCGPVGDCNAVQSSEYARIFGVLPVAVLGLMGYLAILGVWAWGRFRQDRLSRFVPLALYGMIFPGTLYSLYLTYLELFVIKAVCMWCLSSAVIMTLLLLINVQPMLAYFADDPQDEVE